MKYIQIATLVLVAVVGVSLYITAHQSVPLGIAFNQSSYHAATNTSVVCGGSTIVEATDTARTSFIVGVAPSATTSVTVCKAATCTAGASGIVVATSSWAQWEQNDNYNGPYSCAAAASTTLGVTYSD